MARRSSSKAKEFGARVASYSKKHGTRVKKEIQAFAKTEKGKKVIKIVGITAATILIEALPATRGIKILKKIATVVLLKTRKP